METGTKQVWNRGNAELSSGTRKRGFRPRKRLISSVIPLNPTKSHLKNKNVSARFTPFAPVESSRIRVHLCSSVVKKFGLISVIRVNVLSASDQTNQPRIFALWNGNQVG
jgi:hypothetical protein